MMARGHITHLALVLIEDMWLLNTLFDTTRQNEGTNEILFLLRLVLQNFAFTKIAPHNQTISFYANQ